MLHEYVCSQPPLIDIIEAGALGWAGSAVQIVNGYICATSCDVAAAKTGHDPKNPHDDPVKAAALAEQKALASGKPVDASASVSNNASEFAADSVLFGGSLGRRNPVGDSAPATTNSLIDLLV